MKYMLLIHDDEQAFQNLNDGDRQAIYAEYRKFSEDIAASGNYVSGSELQPSSSSTTVRVRSGKRLVTDGPFAETREQLGGYVLIDATDLDEAIGIAARIPVAHLGTIEIRPLEPGAPTTGSRQGAKVGTAE
jgi:hypothetical protein